MRSWISASRSVHYVLFVCLLSILGSCNSAAPPPPNAQAAASEPAMNLSQSAVNTARQGNYYTPSRVVDFETTPVYAGMSLRRLWHSRTFPIDGLGTCEKCHAGREPRSYCLFGMRKFVRCVHDGALQVRHPDCRYIDHPKGGQLVPDLVDWYVTDPSCRFMDALMPERSRAQLPPR